MDTKKTETREFETLAEAHIVGQIDHGDFRFMIWEISDKPPGEERKLCLRLFSAPHIIDSEAIDKLVRAATRKGRYTNLHRSQEIIVLSSLFLHRRFTLPTLVRMGDQPTIIGLGEYDPCHELRAGSSNLADLKGSFELWDQVEDPDFKHNYIRAARLYYFACRLLDKDLGASYLMLTSAIEALAADHALKDEPGLVELNPTLAKVISEDVDDNGVAEKLREAALQGERFIGRRFVEFTQLNIEDKFWDEGTGPDFRSVKKGDITRILKNIYKQRSKTLHEGEPFPAYIYMCPRDRGEICNAPSFMTEGRRWDKANYIPYIHFMERLTNHVLRTALRRHVSAGG